MEVTDSPGVQVHLASREREVLQERRASEEFQERDRKAREDLLVHKEKAGQEPQALQALPDPAVPPDVLDTPESAGPLDLLDTATPLSVSVFLTTGRDTEVHIRLSKPPVLLSLTS